VRAAEIGAAVGDAARREELGIRHGAAAEIERDLAGLGDAVRQAIDGRAHAAQDQPVGIPQARLQPALLLEGRRRLGGTTRCRSCRYLLHGGGGRDG
jgi:hypothetical protein